MLGLRYAFREALIGVRHAKTMAALALGTIALSLLVFGLFLLVTLGLYGAMGSMKARMEIEVYLVEHRSVEDVLPLKKRIEAVAGVERVVYVSKEEAAVRFTKIFGDSLLAPLSENPLPASLEILPAPGFRTAEKMAQIARTIQTKDAGHLIDDLDYGASWAKGFDRLLLGILVIDAVLAAIAGLASVMVVSNAVRLSVLARREVIETMTLVGATDGFIRRPFFLEGLLEGTLGGALAAVALYVVLYVVRVGPFQLLRAADPVSHFSFAPALSHAWSASLVQGILILIPLGAVLGVVGSLVSLSRILAELARA